MTKTDTLRPDQDSKSLLERTVKISTDRKIVAAFGVSLLAMLIFAWYGYHVPRQFIEITDRHKESLRFLEKSSLVLSIFKDAETGQRGYLLTGDESYLQPYRSAVADVAPLLAELMQMTAQRLEQRPDIAELQRLSEAKFSELEETIALRRNGGERGLAEALEVVQEGRGKLLMDEIRRVVGTMRQREDDLRGQLFQASEATAGRLRWITAILCPIAVIVVAGSGWVILRDLAGGARAQQQIDRQRSLLDAVLASMGEGVAVADVGGRMQIFNPMAELLLGAASMKTEFAEWSSNNSLFCVDKVTRFPTDDLPLVRALRGETVDDVEMFVRRPDGQTGIFISANARPITNAKGERQGAVIAFHDITERRQSHETLAESMRRIRELYDHAPCGYHSVNADGMFLEMNSTELGWLGFSRDAIIGKKKFTDLITPDCFPAFEKKIAALMTEGKAHDLEFTMIRRDGTTLPVIINSTAIWDKNGRFLQSSATVIDATERKRADEAIRRFHSELEDRVTQRTTQLAHANQELVQKNQEVELFVYSVSHDLRSPLVNLQGFSQELRMVSKEIRSLLAAPEVPQSLSSRAIELLDQDMDEAVKFIQTAVIRLSNIIDALLRLSRAGRVDYLWETVDLNALVTRIVDSQASTIAATGAAIDVEDLPPVWGDPTAIEQIFANLIGNALNYLSPERRGRIEVGSVAGPDGAEVLTYFVRDNGLGIPQEFHGKIFQAFQRLRPDIGTGEGVGLMLVRRIVERHGGRIWFESGTCGTTFFVSMPIHSEVLATTFDASLA